VRFLLANKQINIKAILILMLSGSAVALGVHLVHGVQVKRHARGLLEEADRFEKDGELNKTVKSLEQYVKLVPDDTEARARFGLLLERTAVKPSDKVRAYVVLTDVVRRDGDQAPTKVRRKVVELGTALYRFSEAEKDLKVLLEKDPKDVELLRLKARCEVGAGRYQSAEQWLAKAIALDAAKVVASEERAQVLRRLKRPEDADQVMEDLVEKNKTLVRKNETAAQRNGRNAAARLAAARYYAGLRLWEKVKGHILPVVKGTKDDKALAPDNAEACRLAADMARAHGNREEARSYLEHGLAKHAGNVSLAVQLAQLELEAGQRDKAREHLRPILKSLPDKVGELWELGNVLLQAGEDGQAETVARRLEEREAKPAAAYLRAGLLTRKGRWGDAREALTQLTSAKLANPELAVRAHFLLAECYERLGNPDAQRDELRRVLADASEWVQARRKLALCLFALGQTERAVTEHRRATSQAPDLRLELARLLLADTLRRPAEERRWDQLEGLLADLTRNEKTHGQATLLRAEMAFAQGRATVARRLAEALRDNNPKEPGPWVFLAKLALREGRGADMPAVLAKAESKAGPHVEFCLVRAGQAASAGKTGLKALAKLEKRLRKFRGTERDRLLGGLAAAREACGDRPGAQLLWRQLLKRKPDDLWPRVTLLESFVAGNQRDDALRMVEEVRRLEGRDGPHGNCGEAACLLMRARRGDKKALGPALALLKKAGKQRPSWPRVPLLEADAHELAGRLDKALEKYQEALEKGEGRLAVFRRAAQLLARQGRYAEADALLRKLPESALASGDLGRLAAEVSLLQSTAPGEGGIDPKKRALDLARKAVAANSTSASDHVWLGRVAAAAGQFTEAERAFRRAVALDGKLPEAWAALIQFLAGRDTAQAATQLAEAERRLPATLAPAVLAAGYEALKRPKEAEQQHRAALAAKPNDPAVLSAAAGFYTRANQPARAEPLLRHLLSKGVKSPPTTVVWARRTLALVLAGQRSYRLARAALRLLDANEAAGETAPDQRARAMVLAAYPAYRTEAIAALKKLEKRQAGLSSDLRLQLARLYEADGNWRTARAQLLGLVTADEKNPVYLAQYARSLLLHGDAAEAAPWVEKLAVVAPDKPETVDLQVQLLKETDRAEEAAARALAYAKVKDARLDLAARWLESLGKNNDAEGLLRVVADDPKQPESQLLLAGFLSRRTRVAEALKICAKAWPTCRPEAVAGACVAAVRSNEATKEQHQQVERWLVAAMRQRRKSGVLPALLAGLYEREGRHREAITLYREALQREPRNVVALNNLAFLLALSGGDPAEALGLVETAIGEAGPLPAFLDTRAVIHLKAGRGSEALKDVTQAVKEQPSAVRQFHLAQAQLLTGSRTRAALALRQARQAGLRPGALHPLEESALRKLSADLR
jgi:tetratricopeptide (TPR) repeat protein